MWVKHTVGILLYTTMLSRYNYFEPSRNCLHPTHARFLTSQSYTIPLILILVFRKAPRLRPSAQCWNREQGLWVGRDGGGLHHRALDRQDLQSQRHAKQRRSMISQPVLFNLKKSFFATNSVPFTSVCVCVSVCKNRERKNENLVT